MAKRVQINDKGVIRITTDEGTVLWGQIKSMQGNALSYKNIREPSEFNAAHNFSEENSLVSYPDGTGASLVLSNKAVAQDLRGKYQPKPLPERTALPPDSKFAEATRAAAASPLAAAPYSSVPPLPTTGTSNPASIRPITPSREATPPSPHYSAIPPSPTSSPSRTVDASGDKSGDKGGAYAPAGTPHAIAAALASTSSASSAPPSPTSSAVPQLTPDALASRLKTSSVSGTSTTGAPVVSGAPSSASSAAITHGLGGAGPSAATGTSSTPPLSSAASTTIPARSSSTPSAASGPMPASRPASSSAAASTLPISTGPAISLHASSGMPSTSGVSAAAPSGTTPSAAAAPATDTGVLKPFIGGSENSIVTAVKNSIEFAVKNNLVGGVGPAYKGASGEDIIDEMTSKIDPVDRNILHLQIPISMHNKGTTFNDAKAEHYADVKVTSQSVSLDNPTHFNAVVFAAMVAAACELCKKGVYPLVLDLNPQKLGYDDAQFDEFKKNVIFPIIREVSRNLKVPDGRGLKIGQDITINEIQPTPAPVPLPSTPTASRAAPSTSLASAPTASGVAPSIPVASAPTASKTAAPFSSSTPPGSIPVSGVRSAPLSPGFVEELKDPPPASSTAKSTTVPNPSASIGRSSAIPPSSVASAPTALRAEGEFDSDSAADDLFSDFTPKTAAPLSSSTPPGSIPVSGARTTLPSPGFVEELEDPPLPSSTAKSTAVPDSLSSAGRILADPLIRARTSTSGGSSAIQPSSSTSGSTPTCSSDTPPRSPTPKRG